MQPTIGTSLGRVDDFAGEPPNFFTLGTSSAIGAPGATPHVPGAWVEIDPATTEAYDGFDLVLSYNTSGQTIRYMLEVGVGAAGSEVVIAGPLGFGMMVAYRNAGASVFIPVFIPRGSRVAVRFRINIAWPASEQPDIGVSLVGRRASGTVTRFGLMATASIDGAATDGEIELPGTYGASSWFELSSAVPFRVRSLVVNFIVNASGVGTSLRAWRLGIGAAASEREIVQFQLRTSASPFVPVTCDIAAGTRLAIQYWATSGGNLGSVGVHLFG